MATDLTPELLQEIAVKVVSQFMTKQAGLSDSIAYEAKNMELNPEQIKRVIETSNTVAYLRQLEDAHDRSFEFPVAEYNQVMSHMVLPDMTKIACDTVDNPEKIGQAPYANAKQRGIGTDDMGRKIIGDTRSPTVDKTVEPLTDKLPEKEEVTKSAGVKTGPLNQKAPVSQINSSITEAAEYDRDNDQQHKIAMLVKETFRVKQTMQKLAEEGFMVSMRLEKLASIVQKDPLGFEKLSHVASPEDLGSLAILCGFEKTAEMGSVFTNNELKEVLSLNLLFKEAKEMVMTQNEMQDFLDRSANILIEKNAFSPIGAGVEAVGKGLGWAARKIVGGGLGTVKKVGTGLAAATAAPTIGKRVERVADVGGAVLAGASTKHDTPVWSSIHGNNS